MGKLADQVITTRAAKNVAMAEIEERIARVKGDREEDGIGGRIAGAVSGAARDAFDEAMQVADESKGIIAGTTALLLIWFLRNPVITWLEETLGKDPDTEGNDSNDDE
ncbi:MAG: hypothetical protein KUG65_07565 [Sphingomonadaceae bacterium]|nr:hypothetical protein [Sphingomonadaceae bacterium]